MDIPRPIITLTTDFGIADGYVGAIKGVIYSICSQAEIVDCAHHIPAQDVLHAALTLESSVRSFPAGTVHVAVVDPGVGSTRRRLLLLTDRSILIGPDNGVFGLVLRHESLQLAYAIENTDFMLKSETTIFDGRDVFAPVAAYIANGLDPNEVGPEIADIQPLDWPENTHRSRSIDGAVITVDHFGNIITSLHRAEFPDTLEDLRAEVAGRLIRGLSATYFDDESSESYRVLFGSMGYLEIAKPGGSAQRELNMQRGDVITVTW